MKIEKGLTHCGHVQGRGPRLWGCGKGLVQGPKVFMNFRRVRTSLALKDTAGVSPGEDLKCPWRLNHQCTQRESISAAWGRTVHGAEVDLLSPKWQSISPPGSQDNCTVLPAVKRPPVNRNQWSLLKMAIGPPAHPFTLAHLTDRCPCLSELPPSYLLSICLSPTTLTPRQSPQFTWTSAITCHCVFHLSSST